MPKVSEDYREGRRRRIITAARICFARKGVHKTTMRDIYAEAGLSSGAIYHYFRSKEEIIRAIYMPDYRRNVALVDALKERSDTLRALEETLDFFYRILDGLDPGGALKINIQTWGEAQHSAEVMDFLRLSFGDYLVSFAEFIYRAQQRGEVNPELDSKAVALLLLAPYLGLELLKSVEPSVDVWKYVTVLKAMFAGRFWLGNQVKLNNKEEPNNESTATTTTTTARAGHIRPINEMQCADSRWSTGPIQGSCQGATVGL